MSKSWKLPSNNFISSDSINIGDSSEILTNKLIEINTSITNLSNNTVPINRGGTGATTKSAAQTNLGIISTVDGNSTFSSKSVANTTDTTLTSITITPGVWILIGYVQFGKNATGYRACWFTTSSTGGNGASGVSCIGSSDYNSFLQSIWTVRATGNTTYYFRGRQYSGTSLNATGGIRALKIYEF